MDASTFMNPSSFEDKMLDASSTIMNGYFENREFYEKIFTTTSATLELALFSYHYAVQHQAIQPIESLKQEQKKEIHERAKSWMRVYRVRYTVKKACKLSQIIWLIKCLDDENAL